jgi:hypothetical protein
MQIKTVEIGEAFCVRRSGVAFLAFGLENFSLGANGLFAKYKMEKRRHSRGA